MIQVMDHNPTYFDIDEEPQSIWPWVLGALALIGVVFLTLKTSSSIEASIAHNVRQSIDAQNVAGVDVAVNGRDVQLTGTVDISVDKPRFISTLKTVDGVRVVNDNLRIFDPKAEAEQRLRLFQSQFSTLDFSALAFERGSASLTQGVQR